MTEILVTYIITIYNKSRYLPDVIEAIYNQEGDFLREYIFIDDGSTDNSSEIINKYYNKNSLYIKQPNSGPAIAINKGINLAKGKYIQIVDGDDLLHKDSTISLLKEIQNAGVVFGGLDKYNVGEPFAPNPPKDYKTIYIKDPLGKVVEGKIKGICSIGATKSLIRADLLKQIQGADERVFTQDFSISLRLACLTDFIFIDRKVASTPTGFASDHLSSNKAREAHDTLLTLLYFMEDHDDFNKTLFARRKNKVICKYVRKFFSQEHLNYLVQKCVPYLGSREELIEEYREALSKYFKEGVKVVN